MGLSSRYQAGCSFWQLRLALNAEGVQFGYSLKNASGLPLTVYGGFDTLKYKSGIGGPLSPFDSMSGTPTGYSAHAGVEFRRRRISAVTWGRLHRPAIGAHRQRHQFATLLPGVSPFAVSGRRY